MTDLPKTEQELEELINARVKEESDKLVSQHNGQMATIRKKYEDEVRKAKEQANMTAEQIAEQKIKEQQEADLKELNDLRAYKKSSEISQRLAKEKLPDFLKNDTRLLNADEGTLDKVIKDVKKDYEASIPSGATHSTIVQTSTGGNPQEKSSKERIYEEAGNQLKESLGLGK